MLNLAKGRNDFARSHSYEQSILWENVDWFFATLHPAGGSTSLNWICRIESTATITHVRIGDTGTVDEIVKFGGTYI